jgi:DNA mismatch repair protein MutS
MIQTTQEKSAKCVKIHETARSDAMLIATSRRIAILKEAIKSNNKSSATLIYKSKYSDTLEPFEFDLKSLEYDTSGGGKNDVVITSQQIKSITSKNEEAKGKLIRETQLIFQKYIQDFIKFDTQLHAIIKYVSEMDILQCKCYIAHKYNYCKPSVINSEDDKSFFSFTGIRHPLIEHLQTNELYVTNDMELGSGGSAPQRREIGSGGSGGSAPQRREAHSEGSAPQRREAQSEGSVPQRHNADNEASGVLLYGTNAVGKTSFIKSVGIAVIMAQAGLYVPCTSFVYKPYQNIFTRILGNDNLFKGLSTFAVEMTELRSILTMANKNSLVLGDELCSGTESDSALSIFTAGLEILHEKESTFLFATHFHEINKYDEIKALTRLKMMHMAVHFNKETNTLVYDRKLREGPGESMYGLEVCKSLSLPDAFLKRAHDIRMKYHADKKNILSYSSTHFNARKLMGNCELCNLNKASEVHHLQHQKNANDTNDYIQTFHKNHVANLLNICEDCHQKIHHTGQQHKVVKTTKGYVLKEVV